MVLKRVGPLGPFRVVTLQRFLHIQKKLVTSGRFDQYGRVRGNGKLTRERNAQEGHRGPVHTIPTACRPWQCVVRGLVRAQRGSCRCAVLTSMSLGSTGQGRRRQEDRQNQVPGTTTRPQCVLAPRSIWPCVRYVLVRRGLPPESDQSRGWRVRCTFAKHCLGTGHRGGQSEQVRRQQACRHGRGRGHGHGIARSRERHLLP